MLMLPGTPVLRKQATPGGCSEGTGPQVTEPQVRGLGFEENWCSGPENTHPVLQGEPEPHVAMVPGFLRRTGYQDGFVTFSVLAMKRSLAGLVQARSPEEEEKGGGHGNVGVPTPS